MVEVPLTSDPSQIVTVTLDGAQYDLWVKWGELRQCWTLDITRTADQALLASGASLFLGVDIIGGFGLGIGSMFVVDLGGSGLEATSDDGDLGTRVKLYYFSPSEIAAWAAVLP